MPNKKEMALHFLKLAAKGKSREAFKLYAGKDFKHHNVYFKGDADTLMAAIEEDAKMNPDKIFEIQRALEDGDLVAVHSRFRQNPYDTDYAVMHIFRFENDKVVELWDFAQAAPAEIINENGMF
jgi:predicted SnoaL-like aldol condensation-catalyzing enzyme